MVAQSLPSGAREPISRAAPDAEPSAASDILHRLRMAASAEGTTLGEWLYNALAEPFAFTGKWAVNGMADRRKKYSRAANAFAAVLAEVIANADPQNASQAPREDT